MHFAPLTSILCDPFTSSFLIWSNNIQETYNLWPPSYAVFSSLPFLLSIKPEYFLGTLLCCPLGRQTKFRTYIKTNLILAVSLLKPYKISHMPSIKSRPSFCSFFFYWHWHHLQTKHANKLQKAEVIKRCCFRHAVLPFVSVSGGI
jgi:hypothetical protein